MGLLDIFKGIGNSIDSTNKNIVKGSIPPKAEPNSVTVKVTGTNYRNKNDIISLAKKNPDYSLDKRALVKKYPEGCSIYEYDFPDYNAVFEFEPTNEYDPNAIKVLIKGKHVGYVKKGSCSRIRNLITQQKIKSITARIRGGNHKSMYCIAGDYKPTLPDYELEKDSSDFSITLTLELKK